jgi:hypothetical protein
MEKPLQNQFLYLVPLAEATDPNSPQNSLQYSNYNHHRVMFSKLYDEVRAGTKLLPNYPSTSDSFYSSGRLPYMVEIKQTSWLKEKTLQLLIFTLDCTGSTDIAGPDMHKYDVELLKDSLDELS